MSGYGTAKFQHNALNLGFPTAFARDYARFGSPEMFSPDRLNGGLDNTVGNDFQAQWHQQKKRDADYMANAKVRSTHNMNARGFSSPHGYYNLPPVVLGQRRFANASMGALYSHSTREDQPSDNAPFHLREDHHSSFPLVPRAPVVREELVGGVLRTSAGQRHGKKVLDERIAQLNAINEAKMTFMSDGNSGRSNTVTPFAGAQGTLDTALGASPLVELANLLQSIKDSLVSHGSRNVSYRDVLQDSSKAFTLMVRMAVNNPASDIANVLEFIEGTSAGDGIGQLLEYQQEELESPDDADDAHFAGRIAQQIEWWGNCVRYLKKMIEVSELPPQTRLQTSNALIKSLGFNKLVRNSEQTYRTGVVRDDDFIDSTGYVNNPQNLQRAQDLQARAGRSGAFINPGPRPLSGAVPASSPFVGFDSDDRYRGFSESGYFTQRAPRREDTQHGYFGEGGAGFSRSAQEAYAYGSGEFLDRSGGRPRAWMGEEVLADYGEAPPDEGAILEAQQQAGLAGVESEAEEDGADATGATPSATSELTLSSRRDPTTGEYDVVAPPRASPGGAPAPAQAKPYKESDIPRTIPEIRAFIQMLNQRHGYNQAIYKKNGADPKPRSVRLNTIAKMKSAGLL